MPTLEDGTHATDLSASFYTHFQAVRNDISTRLESPASGSIDEAEFNSLSSDLTKLRKDFIDATVYLPSYDRGQCEQQLKALEVSVLRHRVPKTKFAFKRKPVDTSARPSPTTPLSSSHHTPTLMPTTTNLTLASHSSALLTRSSLSHDAAQMPSSSDITLTDLSTCIVDLFESQNRPSSLMGLNITALHARGLRRVVLLIPPIEGSVLLHDVHESVIVVGCRQFRIHDSTNTTILLHVLSNPTIEGSHDIQIGEYPAALRDVCTSAKDFFARPSHHTLVQDFDWIKPPPSPNWSILDPSSKLAYVVAQHANFQSGLVDRADVTSAIDQVLQARVKGEST